MKGLSKIISHDKKHTSELRGVNSRGMGLSIEIRNAVESLCQAIMILMNRSTHECQCAIKSHLPGISFPRRTVPRVVFSAGIQAYDTKKKDSYSLLSCGKAAFLLSTDVNDDSNYPILQREFSDVV